MAPFPVPGIVAGAVHLPLRELLLGTLLGNLPGVLAATLLGDRLQAVLRDPRPVHVVLLAGVGALVLAAAYLGRRSLSRVHLPVHRP
jgi:uncharacterized membrane protein YdjX (TVP38/TMEM64 family)